MPECPTTCMNAQNIGAMLQPHPFKFIMVIVTLYNVDEVGYYNVQLSYNINVVQVKNIKDI